MKKPKIVCEICSSWFHKTIEHQKYNEKGMIKMRNEQIKQDIKVLKQIND